MSTGSDFKEWFLPPLPWWFLSPGFGFAVAIAMWPINATVAITVGVVIAILIVGLLAMWAPRTEVRNNVLYAGPAHIETKWLGPGRKLSGEELRAALGTELDLRTWVCVRPWMKRAVFIENIDPQDPAPAWIVASRRPNDLLRALADNGADPAPPSNPETD